MTAETTAITKSTPPRAASDQTLSMPAEAALFLALVAILLLPAWLNGFPFVMSDSIAYSGQGVNWMRSKTAAVAMAPLYDLLGYWALPVVNALLTAAAWLVLARLFGFGRLAFLILPLSVLALQPLYASAVMVDIWFFAAIAFGLAAMVWSSPFLALVTGILLSAHGSGILLFAPFAVLAAILFRKPRFLVYAGVAVGSALVVTTALDMRHHSNQPRLEKIFFAARLFSAFPDLLADECRRSGNQVLCTAAERVDALRQMPEHAGRRDFFWELNRELQPEFDLQAFERDHAVPIILHGLVGRPLAIAGLVLRDLVSFYGPDTTFDFLRRPDEAMPDGFATSRQAAGMMQDALAKRSASALRFTLYLITAATLLASWRSMDRDTKRWTFLFLALSLGNDILFATLSGPPDRYHHRVLGFLAISVLVAISASKRGTGESR